MTFAALRRLMPPSEPPSLRSIERDLDDEFAFHVASIEAELVADGVAPAAARAAARDRFGDVHKVKARCRRIALEEYLMSKRIHIVVTAGLAVTVVVLVLALLVSARARAVSVEQAHMMAAHAMNERERSEQLTRFLSGTLNAVAPDPAPGTDVAALLDQAAARVAIEIDDPDVAARLLATIERARAKLRDERRNTSDPGTSDPAASDPGASDPDESDPADDGGP